MGRLKEKLKPEKLTASFLAYIAGYLICIVSGLGIFQLGRELIYEFDRLRYYGWATGSFGDLPIFLLCVILFYGALRVVCKRAHKKAKKELKRKNGLYGMPVELCAALYLAAEIMLVWMWAGASGFYPYTGVIGLFLFVHFCENMVQRRDRGLIINGSLYDKVRTAAQRAGIVIPFMTSCSIISVLLFLYLVCLLVNGELFYMRTVGSIVRFLFCTALTVGIPCVFWYLCWCFYKLKTAGEALKQGQDGYRVDTHYMLGSLKVHGENLNSIGEGVNKAVEARLKSERLKTELITNVSHDIKTPLTSIINYADLISKEETDNPRIKEYADVLGKQSQKLKRLIENLIEASKASTGNIPVELKPCNLNVLLAQMASEYEQRLKEKNLVLIAAPVDEEIFVMADGSQLWRVFDNLLGNICKYAMENTRVYLDVSVKDYVEIILKNISRQQLNFSEEELMERFTRGDNSRSTSGNGLGLSIAQSLMKLQNGSLHLLIDGDLFKAVVRLEKTEAPGSQEISEIEN